MSDDGEVERRGVLSGSAAVFVEGHVQRPVKALDAPMSARRGEDGLGIGFEGREVVAGFEAFAAGLFVDAPGGDGGDGTQILPIGMAFGEPRRLGGPATALFDPAVAGVGLRRRSRPRSRESSRRPNERALRREWPWIGVEGRDGIAGL